MKIFFKNMVCIRCKLIVKAELEEMGIRYMKVELGEADVEDELTQDQLNKLDLALRKSGIEILESKKSILVEKIKTIIIEQVHYVDEPLTTNLSTFLADTLNHDYTYLANLFSVSQGTTIEKFYIAHRVERIKELLLYDELNITEIARMLHYSSVAHMSNQFKKTTGLTPSFFKHLKNPHRTLLEDL
jgi:YesN/AraC family two-component response regulator